MMLTVSLGDNDVFDVPQKDESTNKYMTDDIVMLDNTTTQDGIYVKILDNIPETVDMHQFIDFLTRGIEYFDEVIISAQTKARFESWVRKYGKHAYTWEELTLKPNYGLELLNRRFWPYIKTEHKEWQDIANRAEQDYPVGESNAGAPNAALSKSVDYKTEHEISQRYNNYLGYTVLDPRNYPDMDSILYVLDKMSEIGMKHLMFEAVLRLLVTPDACHIIKYTKLWELVNPLLEKKIYKDIFMHFMYYAMFVINHEDTIMFSQVRRKYRVIHSHVEALNMPSTAYMHLEKDPYIQQLAGHSSIVKSVPYYLRIKRKINSVAKFERRLYLATGGALANIPLNKFKASISGSILIPTFTYSELEDHFKGARYNTKRHITTSVQYNDDLYKSSFDLTEEDKDFMSYLEYYYPSYHSYKDTDFVKKVLTKGTNETRTEYGDEKKEHNEPQGKKEKSKYNVISDIDIGISVDNYDTFEDLALMLVGQIRKNCQHIGEVWMQKVYTASSFKFKLYGAGLIRPIDLFRVSSNPEKMVKKFHMPIVRSWYDGANAVVEDKFKHSKVIDEYWKKENEMLIEDSFVNITKKEKEENYIGLNILNSCLMAALSGVNGTYKWFFNSKPCVEVVLKYIQRGISVILNAKELKALIEYMPKSERWKGYTLPVKEPTLSAQSAQDTQVSSAHKPNGVMHVVGSVSKFHQMFNPCMLENGIRFKLRSFSKPARKIYNHRMHVGDPRPTEYKVDLSVKENTKVYPPDIGKINTFMEHAREVEKLFE